MAMTRKEREDFLRGVHVGVISITNGDRGPMTVPVWYDYEPGGVLCLVTSRHSRKGQLLEQTKRISLCVQTEEMPYQYVSVEGPIISIEAHRVGPVRTLSSSAQRTGNATRKRCLCCRIPV